MRKLAYLPENALNAVCPYFTMFPLEYPLRILKRNKNTVSGVLDPFCGRGTTLFAARKCGVQSWGIDTSPVAVAIARAKLASVDSEAIIALAERFVAGRTAAAPKGEFFEHAFHPDTLQQICRVRRGLLNVPIESDASSVLRAIMLGILHGPKSKARGQESYLSNQMPRTFASKPDYAVRFWRHNRLKARKLDVIKLIRRKLERITVASQNSSPVLNVSCGDSCRKAPYRRAKGRYSAVITSPPYYGMRTYLQDQWLRYWFVGGPSQVDYSSGLQLTQSGKHVFVESLGKVWCNAAENASDSLDLFVRLGAIASAQSDPKRLFLESLESSGLRWRVLSMRDAGSADNGKRQADQMIECSASTELDFHARCF